MKIPTIKRTVGDKEMEFELTAEECWAAHLWVQYHNDIEDCCAYIYQNKEDDSDVDDDTLNAMVELYRSYRDRGYSEEHALLVAYDYYFKN